MQGSVKWLVKFDKKMPGARVFFTIQIFYQEKSAHFVLFDTILLCVVGELRDDHAVLCSNCNKYASRNTAVPLTITLEASSKGTVFFKNIQPSVLHYLNILNRIIWAFK